MFKFKKKSLAVLQFTKYLFFFLVCSPGEGPVETEKEESVCLENLRLVFMIIYHVIENGSSLIVCEVLVMMLFRSYKLKLDDLDPHTYEYLKGVVLMVSYMRYKYTKRSKKVAHNLTTHQFMPLL